MIGPLGGPADGAAVHRAGGPTQGSSAEQAEGGRPDRLREASEQMEGVFMQFFVRALRSTVPNGGNADAPGADVYASLLDEHLAQVLADRTQTGIAEALYRQLGGAGDLSIGGEE